MNTLKTYRPQDTMNCGANYLSMLLFFIIIWGCSSQEKNQLPKQLQELENLTVYSADAKPEEIISFKKEAAYGNSEEVLIGKMGDIAVDSSGRVYIADVQDQRINVFQSDGRFLSQLGREGRGPIEFNYIRRLQIRNNHLYASDSNFGTRRVHIFTLDTLASDETIVLARNRSEYESLANAYPGLYRIYVRNNGTYLAQSISHGSNPTQRWQNKEMKSLLYPLDSTGKIASDKLIEFTEEIRTYHRGLLPIEPFLGKTFTVLSSDNTIYQARPDRNIF